MDISFRRTKSLVESSEIESHFGCLKTIVLNVSEVCNLECPMCPRSSGYKSTNKFMSIDTAAELSRQLTKLDYRGIVSISGMGEPCINKDLLSICNILYGFKVQVITNGTLDYDYKTLSKYAKILVSVHDWSQIDEINKRFVNVPVIIRNHDTTSPDCELKITNRGGWNNQEQWDTVCNYPFYKTIIDHDGCYLLCCDDWKRFSKDNTINISSINIEDYFCNHLNEAKSNMLTKGRLCEPCNHCNTNGKLIGSNIVEWYIKNVYQRKD